MIIFTVHNGVMVDKIYPLYFKLLVCWRLSFTPVTDWSDLIINLTNHNNFTSHDNLANHNNHTYHDAMAFLLRSAHGLSSWY
ncbi:hypothetical protein A9317_12885 [Yersinia pestis]|nr:hypothetical protein A9317_12885 [Yersinia pestis]